MQEGILAKLHQKMQLQMKAENGASRLRDIVAKQAEKGKQAVSVAQGGQEKAIGAVNRTIRLSMSLILAIAAGSAVMQVSVTQAVGQMHHERQTVSTILREVNTTLDAIDRIVQYVDRVTDMVRRSAVATEEQSATSSEVSQHVEEIALLTRELSGSCRGIRESSNDLSRLATDLNGMVGWFRV